MSYRSKRENKDEMVVPSSPQGCFWSYHLLPTLECLCVCFCRVLRWPPRRPGVTRRVLYRRGLARWGKPETVQKLTSKVGESHCNLVVPKKNNLKE